MRHSRLHLVVPMLFLQGKLVRTLEGHGHRINSLAVSSDYVCRTGPFALGSKLNSRTLRPPTAETGRRRGGEGAASGAGEEPSVTAEASARAREEAVAIARERYEEFRRQGPERLVSGSDDFTLFLWDPESEKKSLARMTGHQQPVNHISFSPDGRFIASASFDKKVRLWDGRTGKCVSPDLLAL